MEDFLRELIALCAKHGAVLYPRTDGKAEILSVEIAGIWTDFKRISAEGAKPLT
jgi:hypothetical protein